MRASDRFIRKAWHIYILIAMNAAIYVGSYFIKSHPVSEMILRSYITLLTLIEVLNLIALFYFCPWKITNVDADAFIIRKSWIIYGLIILNGCDAAFFFLRLNNITFTLPFGAAIMFNILKDITKAFNLIALFRFRPWIFINKKQQELSHENV
jgi:hypothetical protein